MTIQLGLLDYIIFFGTLVGVMLIGFLAGRKDKSSEDYFLAGRSIRWFGVAGSIFGSNVSANHMVGMLGIGFSIGFAQSHFELGAIAGLLLMCYGFLPVYRKLKIYTLSEYLERRFDHRSRLMYAVIMVTLMAFVQMVPALYIGSRTICELMGGNATVTEGSAGGAVQSGEKGADDTPRVDESEATVAQLAIPTKLKRKVNMTYYIWFVIALGVIAASYTILGGLKAVIYTDVIQSVLMLFAGIGVAFATFHAIGGWGQMMAFDNAAASSKMNLYLPTNHPDLPWSGVLTGLMCMHCFYWGTNQFIVQRALAATSDKEARTGIIVAGFLKLLIPFFAIATGVAAFYLFKNSADFQGQQIDPDTAFPVLINTLIKPFGMGLVGLIAAGLIGAILSSIDSMMNSAATIITVDIYKRYFRHEASDREMIRMGQVVIVVLMVAASAIAILVINPNSEKNFFLTIADYSNILTPGLLVAFLLGIFWKRGTRLAAFVTILAGIAFSLVVPPLYNSDMPRGTYDLAMTENSQLVAKIEHTNIKNIPEDLRGMTVAGLQQHLDQQVRPRITPLMRHFGPQLNFFHRVIFVILLSGIVFVVVSQLHPPDPEKSRYTWTDLGGHAPDRLRSLALTILVSILFYALLGWLMYQGLLDQTIAALVAAAWTLGAYLREILRSTGSGDAAQEQTIGQRLLRDERSLAGLLAATAMFMMYYFY
jgi:SSS family solute:Na+ symporter